MPQPHERVGSAARGATRMAFEAVTGLTRIVEGMHANIAAAPPPLGEGTDGRTRGITGLVYESIRQVSGGAGFGVDRALALLDRMVVAQPSLPQPKWDAAVSALNGVFGDHLVETENPLAIPMQLRRQGRPLEFGNPDQGRKLLVMIHGLCMSDRQWRRKGHDHGAALARELGYTPLYLHYNSGRHVSENGREFAGLLEAFVAASATPVEEIAILAHSMGGLVARSACHVGAAEGLEWMQRLRRIVFLGTPHHGAPLERAGNWVNSMAELSPYVAPLARLGMLRSAGITDLRHGSLVDEDWQASDERALPRPVALPEGVDCHAIAATLSSHAETPGLRVLGDGLVPRASALGRHANPARVLPFEDAHQWTGTGMSHFDLLSRPEVYGAIRNWLSG